MKLVKYLLLIAVIACSILAQASNCCMPCDPLQCHQWGVRVNCSYVPYGLTFNRPDTIIGPFPGGFLLSSGNRNNFFTPYSASLEIEFALSNHVEMFGEFSYTFAKGKVLNKTYGGIQTIEDYSRLGIFGAYLGARYYFQRWCWGGCLFAGGKMGIASHFSRRYSVIAESPTFFDFRKRDISRTTIVPSGGFHLGLDYLITEGFSVDVSAEVLFTGAPKMIDFNTPNQLNPYGISRVIIGQKGPIVSYPITLGVRKTF